MLKEDVLSVLKEREDYCSGQELCERFHVTRTAVWKAIARLKEEGYQIEARRNRGYFLRPVGDVMNETELKEALAGIAFLRGSSFFPVIDSTNSELRRRAEQGAQAPILVVADQQSAGRGRRGRSWDSPAGTGVWMSLLLRPTVRPERASVLTLVCALAVADAIREVTGLETGIKWPNDVVIGGKKVCGILTEMNTDMDAISYVILGIGINVNTEYFPEEIRATATSLKIERGEAVSRTAVIGAIIRRFADYFEKFEKTEDMSALKDSYEAQLVNRGREVLVLDPRGEYRGSAQGITLTGELLVRTEKGDIAAIRSGEVSVRGIYGYV